MWTMLEIKNQLNDNFPPIESNKKICIYRDRTSPRSNNPALQRESRRSLRNGSSTRSGLSIYIYKLQNTHRVNLLKCWNPRQNRSGLDNLLIIHSYQINLATLNQSFYRLVTENIQIVSNQIYNFITTTSK